jgi:hypothetical protein
MTINQVRKLAMKRKDLHDLLPKPDRKPTYLVLEVFKDLSFLRKQGMVDTGKNDIGFDN